MHIPYSRKASTFIMFLVAIAVYLVLIVAVLIVDTVSSAPNGDTVVYTTRTGECYHKKNCSTVGVGYKRTLADAVHRGYSACERCHPPQLKDGARVAWLPLDFWGFARTAFGLVIWGYYLTWVVAGIFAMFSTELRFLKFRWYAILSALTVLVLYALTPS